MRRFRRSTRWALIGASVAAAVVGGVAWATIPNEGGVINACYLKSGGTLRVIDASVTSCKKTETAISWGARSQAVPGPGVSNGEQGVSIPVGRRTLLLRLKPMPPVDPGTSTGWVALGTVWMQNNEIYTVNAFCEVLGDDGVGRGWPYPLQPGTNLNSFPAGVSGDTVSLYCGVDPAGNLHDPDGIDIKAVGYVITAVPNRYAPSGG